MTAWTTPRTWVTGEVLSAANMNAHVRDNMIFYGGTDCMTSSPPASPGNGQRWVLPVDTTNGVFWHFIYYTTLTAWVFQGGAALRGVIATRESSVSGTYAALTTPGPSITLPRAGDYRVTVEFHGDQSANGAGIMSFDTGGTGAIDADSAGATTYQNASATTPASAEFTTTKIGVAASTALTAKYKVSAGTQFFADRTLLAQPVKVT